MKDSTHVWPDVFFGPDGDLILTVSASESAGPAIYQLRLASLFTGTIGWSKEVDSLPQARVDAIANGKYEVHVWADEYEYHIPLP